MLCCKTNFVGTSHEHNLVGNCNFSFKTSNTHIFANGALPLASSGRTVLRA